jgi:hypothetical protein
MVTAAMTMTAMRSTKKEITENSRYCRRFLSIFPPKGQRYPPFYTLSSGIGSEVVRVSITTKRQRGKAATKNNVQSPAQYISG